MEISISLTKKRGDNQIVRHFARYLLKILPIAFITAFQLTGFALALYNSSKNPDFSDLYYQAKQERSAGHFQKSIDLFLKCLSLVKNAGSNELDCLSNLAILYWNVGDLKESKNRYSSVANLAIALGSRELKDVSQSAIKIHDLYQEGKTLRLAEKYHESIDAFEAAITLANSIQSPEMVLKCKRQLSLTLWEINDFAQFYQLNLAALKLAELINHNRERGRCLNNIAVFYSRHGDYGSALNTYEKALKIATEENCEEDIATSLLNLGGIWSDLGSYEKSLEYLNKALELDRKLADKLNIAKDLNNIGIAKRLKGLSIESKDYLKEAEEAFKQSLALARRVRDQGLEIQTLNNIGSVYADLHQYRDALVYFRQAALIAENTNNSSYLGMVYNNIGITYSSLGSFKESIRHFNLALRLSSAYQDRSFVWETYLELGNTRKKQIDYAGALKDYKNAIKSIEEIRSRIKLEELKASYLGTDKRIEAYQNIIDLLVTLHGLDPNGGYAEEAFNYLERARARAFLESLEVADIDISQGISPVLAKREKEILRNISKAYNKLLAPSLPSEDRDKIVDHIKASEDQLETLKREIRISSPAYADLKYPKVVTCCEAQEQLPTPDEAYIAYSIGKETSHAFVITRRGLKIFSVPGRDLLRQQVIDYRKAISDPQNTNFDLGRELFSELVSPGLDPEVKKIIFVPDDLLCILPFETFLMSREPNSWLVNNYLVGYAPSVSSLRVLLQRHRNGARPRKDLLVIGNPVYGSSGGAYREPPNPAFLYDSSSSQGISLSPLKYSALEIERISRLFRNDKVTLLEKESATERWLKSNPLIDYKILHFAVHSVLDDRKPARSAIVLSYNQNQVEDGLLQTRDIYNLRLNADLVTLSACQTGLGQFIRGEGIEGLSRAFFYAGSSSVLISLWAVNDQATYLLMERFYRHLKGSDSLMGALRAAKLEMIRSHGTSHPSYWAGFIISGRADTRVFPGGRNQVVLLAGLLGACAIIVLTVAIHKQKRS
jgi:CHAT domain-containing protein/Tfp pilus assembly protein PilF